MYPTPILLNETTAARRRVPIWLVDATDGITAETGVTGKPSLSINGGASAGATNNIVEVDAGSMPGLYYIELDASEVTTEGLVLASFKTAATAQWHGSAWIYTSDWDTATAGHIGAGTFGALMNTIYLNTFPASVSTNVSSAVWDEATAAHVIANTFGYLMEQINAAIEHLSREGGR